MSCTLKGGHRPPFYNKHMGGFVLCSVLVSGSSVGACLVVFEELDCWGHALYFGRWPSATFFLIGMWFCFVFCVGACLVLFVSLVVRGMPSTSENGLRSPSFRIGNIRHVVLFVVLC